MIASCLILAVFGPAYAQITFTPANVSAFLAPGATETDHSDTITLMANIGSPGSTSWDFSALNNNSTSTIVGVAPDSTPFFSFFPGATHARTTVIPGAGTSYDYLTLGTNLISLGGVLSGLTDQRVSIDPPQMLVQFPLTYGTQWTTTYTDSAFLQGRIVVTQHTDTYTVDAYGPLTLPGGLTSQALRVRVDQRTSSGFVQITYGIKSLNGMSVNIYVIDTTQPNSGTINVAGFTWNDPIGGLLTVTNPGSLETVVAGEPYTIQWKASGIDSIKIELSLDSGRTFMVIVNSTPASANQYLWTVPDTVSAKCRIRLTDLADTTTTVVSSQFRIKPYILTRFKANGDYEPFDPKIHGWQFANSRTNMWPMTWWQQFNYKGGADPITAQPYDTLFKGIPNLAFPDWPLFVSAFGIDTCYESSSPVIYSRRAYWYWRSYITRWGGSCFGFSVGSLLNFDFPTAFHSYFPELGSFTNIHDLTINDNSRRVINQLFLCQFGLAAMDYKRQQWDKTPRQLVDDLKSEFLSDIRNDCGISLNNLRESGGHSVVPYKLERSVGIDVYYNVYVYDNNCPDNDCGNGVQPVFYIDSTANSWSYQDWVGDGSGVFLVSPANTFLNRPIFHSAEPIAAPGRQARVQQATGSYLELMNSTTAFITLFNTAGDSIGFRDSSVFITVQGGFPIIPATSTFQPPLGYDLPNGSYHGSMTSFPDTSSRLTVFDTLSLFSYWRDDATPTQTDRFSYHNGLAVGNPDPQTKKTNMEAVLTLPTNERAWRISNCHLAQSDSIQTSLPDSNQMKLINLGTQKTYDLYVQIGGTGIAGKYNHTGITVPANSTHYIRPNWPDLTQPLKILVDSGNTGTISDTLSIVNQVTGVREQLTTGIPSEFALEQNYPNPFNPVTVIHYSLPKESHVTLTVYNVLGQIVAILVNETEQMGYKSATFNGNNLPSGLYFYRLAAGTFSDTKKMMLVK